MNAAAARLRARPRSGRTDGGVPQGWELDVPAAGHAGEPCALAVVFHGAGSTAPAGLGLLPADPRLIRLAPQSLGSTWDLIRGVSSHDVERLDDALESVFTRFSVDPRRVALTGFSDGASYALSLGVGNGDLVTHIVAFSPGFLAPTAQRGRPRCFITHGTQDRILPIDRCSRRLVPALRGAGYEVSYEEFDGGHVVLPEHARDATDWIVRGPD
jgi:phospholipase/carboxylesterase